MGLLCFLLDLPALPPLLLNDIKRILLRVANVCSTLRWKLQPPSSLSRSVSANIAVCCIDRASMSEAFELRIIYKSMDLLNLREFHHAVTNLLPSTSLGCSGHSQVSSLGALLQPRDGLLSWASQHNGKKIIMISSHFFETTGSFRPMLMEAADHCIAIDFIQFSLRSVDQSFFESGSQEESLPDLAENIGEFENCTFQQVPWDIWQLASLEKKWIQDMVNDVEGPMEIMLMFQEKLYKDTDKVFCSLRPLLVQLTDSIQPCQTCRCHGAVMDPCITRRTHRSNFLCPVTGQELDNHDFTSNGVKVGSHTVLYLPSFMNPVEPAKLFTSSRPLLAFTVLKCILLSTLSEGLLFGDPYIVVPSSEVDVDDDGDKLEINDGVFSSLCEALHSQDCGLLCTSSSDIETRMEKSFPCYYLLLPADKRSILAKRIAASEEFLQLPLPDLKNQELPLEMRDSVSSCLSKLGVQSYNPLNHERGLHNKLNWLAKESLQFHSMPVQRSQTSKAGQPPSNQTVGGFDGTSQMLPGETNSAMGERENGTDRLLGALSHRGRGGCAQAERLNQGVFQKQPAPKASSYAMNSPALAGTSTSSLSHFSLKPLLPLQVCPKPPNNRVTNSSVAITTNQRQTEPAKPTSGSTPLKPTFRRIKQGRV